MTEKSRSKQMQKFKEFFSTKCLNDIAEQIRTGQLYFLMDFKKLLRFDTDLADEVLNDPEDTLKIAEAAITDMGWVKDIKQFSVIPFNISKKELVGLGEIRSNHIGKLIMIEGQVRTKSEVKPNVVSAKFECPNCGNIITVLQSDKRFKAPTKCGCGRKGKFKELSNELVDAYKIVLEETPDETEGDALSRRVVVLKGKALTNKKVEKEIKHGIKIKVIGIVIEIPVFEGTTRTTTIDLVLDAKYVDFENANLVDNKLSAKDELELKEFSKDKEYMKKLIDSIAPNIYGHENIKEAMLLQFAGGVRKVNEDKSILRGDIHILLVGDPGCGKSQLLKKAAQVVPKSRYVSGKGASGVGLTATVSKDEIMGGWQVEAGALVLANGGVCMIDEFDKMSDEDRTFMHEVMEQQTVSIAKASIQATLNAATTILAAANPKQGRFDPYDVLSNQFNISPTLINRFDLIFTIRDLPSQDKDERLASFILDTHEGLVERNTPLDSAFLRKYLTFARKQKPTLTKEAMEELKKFFLKMRGQYKPDDGIQAIPLNARQLEALIRLSEASAKLRLSDRVTPKDSKVAIRLLRDCLADVGTDPETGKIDIDRLTIGVPASARNHRHLVKEYIYEHSNGAGVDFDTLIEEMKKEGIRETELDNIISKLKNEGEIFEPKRNHFQKAK